MNQDYPAPRVLTRRLKARASTLPDWDSDELQLWLDRVSIPAMPITDSDLVSITVPSDADQSYGCSSER
jgi:hypothetical protein